MRFNSVLAILLIPVAGCGSLKSMMALDSTKEQGKPISNPFADYQPGSARTPNETMIFRTKKGDGALEVEIPRANQDMSDFIIPISPGMKNSSDRAPASERDPASRPMEKDTDLALDKREPGVADLEITKTFPHGSDENEGRRRDIEQELGLVRAEESTPERQKSYLASVDRVKRLYRSGRYEAALLETDDLIRDYPTNPQLYEMRGTLFERVGHLDLALKAWKQALRFNPANEPLRRFIERKEQKRSLASP